LYYIVDVREDDGKPVKAVDSIATGGSVKRTDLTSKSKSLGISSSEEWVTTRQRSRAQSGGVREKSFDDVTCGKQPDLVSGMFHVDKNVYITTTIIMLYFNIDKCKAIILFMGVNLCK